MGHPVALNKTGGGRLVFSAALLGVWAVGETMEQNHHLEADLVLIMRTQSCFYFSRHG